MVDPGSPLTVKARCAYYILDQTRKGIETEEIETRVAELEQTALSPDIGGRCPRKPQGWFGFSSK
jgi:hypothetical protein